MSKFCLVSLFAPQTEHEMKYAITQLVLLHACYRILNYFTRETIGTNVDTARLSKVNNIMNFGRCSPSSKREGNFNVRLACSRSLRIQRHRAVLRGEGILSSGRRKLRSKNVDQLDLLRRRKESARERETRLSGCTSGTRSGRRRRGRRGDV